MKIRNTFLTVVPIVLFLFSITGLFSEIKLIDHTNMIKYHFNNDYKAAWKKVDSLEQKGLTRSALEVVEEIYIAAKKDGNQSQFIKSVFYKLKYGNYIEEDSHVKIVNDVKAEIDSASFPANAILESILANIYWQYYQNNRWRFQQRTETVNFENEDFQTWDLSRLNREIVKHFHASLINRDQLKRISIQDFKDILYYSDSQQAYLRPTLFDLLAHSALSFYINDEASVTDPVYKFELNSKDDFSSPEDFVDIEYQTNDSLSLNFYAIQLYQDLIEFHLNDDEKDALIDVDLARLNFVRNNSVHTEKDELYLNALIKLEEKFSAVPYSSLISFNIANYYYSEGAKYNADVSDDYKWDFKKALEICNSTIEKYPDTFGAQECRWLRNSILQKSLRFQTEYGNIAEKPFRSLVSFKNVDRIFIRIIKWSDNLDRKEIGKNIQELVEFYASQNPVKEWAIDLPDDKDYQNHSVEIKMPSLSFGRYLVLAATDKNFTYRKKCSCIF